MNHRPTSASPNPYAEALQACIHDALAEGPGMAKRWVAGLLDSLRQQEGKAANYHQKTLLIRAGAEMARSMEPFESRWVNEWKRAITEALNNPSPGQSLGGRRPLSQVKFEELELMDDDQVQATVEIARVQQAVQAAADQALGELSARLSRAQGFGVVRTEQNPLRPEVVVLALSRTLEGLTKDPAVRGLWLQHGSMALSAELQLLYRHLGRLLDKHGVQPADYAVTQAPVSSAAARAAAAQGGRGSGMGWGPGDHEGGPVGASWPGNGAGPWSAPSGAVAREPTEAARSGRAPLAGHDDFRPSSLLTLSHLHRLLVSGVGDSQSGRRPPDGPSSSWSTPGARSVPEAVVPYVDEGGAAVRESERGGASSVSGADNPSAVADVPLPTLYTGPERRRRGRDAPLNLPMDDADAEQLKLLAEEVVGMLLDGIARDARLLPSVSQALTQLRPVFLRIAHESPRFFADRQNPARRLLDEMTQRSLAFSSEQSPGFDGFLGAVQGVVKLLSDTHASATTQFQQALQALQAESGEKGSLESVAARTRAVESLVRVEQRFFLARKVAQELADRKDVARASGEMRQFLLGAWAQVIALARMDPHAATPVDGKLPPATRYQGVVSDLLWSCRTELASRNRTRLARVIPLLLRNLREGLQSIEYPQAQSMAFFNQLMVLHEAALKGPEVPERRSPTRPSEAAWADSVASAEKQPWLRSSESQETGFMDVEEEHSPAFQHSDFADTQPMFPALSEPAAAPLPVGIPALGVGAWLELVNSEGQAQRARLEWASPHGTMYLFNTADGKSVSMTRRSFEALWQRGQVRLVAGHSMVDDALDHVMDAAVRNSARPD